MSGSNTLAVSPGSGVRTSVLWIVPGERCGQAVGRAAMSASSPAFSVASSSRESASWMITRPTSLNSSRSAWETMADLEGRGDPPREGRGPGRPSARRHGTPVGPGWPVGGEFRRTEKKSVRVIG